MARAFVIVALPESLGQPMHYFNGMQLVSDWRAAEIFLSERDAIAKAESLGAVVDVLSINVSLGEHVRRVYPPQMREVNKQRGAA